MARRERTERRRKGVRRGGAAGLCTGSLDLRSVSEDGEVTRHGEVRESGEAKEGGGVREDGGNESGRGHPPARSRPSLREVGRCKRSEGASERVSAHKGSEWSQRK